MLFHLLLVPPKSKVPLVDGRMEVLTLEVKLTVSLVASPRITLPLKVDIPLTVRLSSIIIVPPAESIVKLPVVVSISLSPLIPS